MWCSCEYLFSYLQHELYSSKVWVVRVELLGVLQDLGFPGGSAAKNPPTVWETWVRSLSWEDPWRRARLLTSVSGLENSMGCIIHRSQRVGQD